MNPALLVPLTIGLLITGVVVAINYFSKESIAPLDTAHSTENWRRAEERKRKPFGDEPSSPNRDEIVINVSVRTENEQIQRINNARPTEITYTDRKGKTTRRVIIAQSAVMAEIGGGRVPVKISGYCTQAKARRTFNAAQIQMMVDPETGEVLDISKWLANHFEK